MLNNYGKTMTREERSASPTIILLILAVYWSVLHTAKRQEAVPDEPLFRHPQDTIFQGFAISLIAGEVASTLLSRLAIPVLHFYANRKLSQEASVLSH